MSDVKNILNANRIKVNFIKIIIAIGSIAASIIGFQKATKVSKKAFNVVSGIAGAVLLVTEVEKDFKPIEDESQADA